MDKSSYLGIAMSVRRGVLPRRRWCAVVVALSSLLISLTACTSEHRHVPAPPSRGGVATRAAVPSPAKASTVAIVAPWNPTVVSDLSLEWITVVSAGGALFGVSDVSGGFSELVRIDPATGLVIQVPVIGEPSPPVVANGAIWVASDSRIHGAVVLQWFDLATLARRGSTTVSFTGDANDGTKLAADPSGNRIYLGSGNSVAVLDATTGKVDKRLRVDGQVSGLAVAPVRSRVYVDSATALGATLRILDVDTCATITTIQGAQAQISDPGTSIVAATTGGLWLSTAGGHTQELYFATVAVLTPERITHEVLEGSGGGGPYASVTFAKGVAWIGGPNTIACANPDTGAVFAHEKTGTGNEAIVLTSIAFVGNTAYAAYENNNGAPQVAAVVRITPPAACFHH